MQTNGRYVAVHDGDSYVGTFYELNVRINWLNVAFHELNVRIIIPHNESLGRLCHT